MSWDRLPKFLLCNPGSDTVDDRLFVLRCHPPRFVVESVPGGEGELLLIDEAGPGELAALKTEARRFFEGD